MNKNKLPKKRIFFLLCSAVLLIVTLVPYSLGWFTFNKEAQTDGIGMKADGLPYEIRTSGIIVDYNGLTDDANAYKNSVQSIFGKLTETYETEIATSATTYYTAADKTSIQWLMNEDSFFDDNSDTGKRFRPGTSGKLTFQVVTTEQKKLTIHCDMKLITFDDSVNEITSTSNPDKKVANEYLRGHILLFEEHTGSTYSKQIPFKLGNSDTTSNTGFTFEVDTTNASDITVTTETVDGKTIYLQEKTIYWVWPNTLGQMLFTSDSPNNGTDIPLLSDVNERATITNLVKNDEASPKNYFKNITEYSGTTDLDFDTVIEFLQTTAMSGDYEVYYQRLNDAYNRADQAIGTNIRYVVFQMDTY